MKPHNIKAFTLTATLLFGSFCGLPLKTDAKQSSVPKNIIIMIGDGMGIGQMEIARQLEYGKKGVLNMEKMEHLALMHTYSENNSVTDSAAGGTAIATGVKTNNGSIATDPSGKEIDSILDASQMNGKRAGIISTSMITDATPAAFSASAVNRWTGNADIARQIYKHNLDVILGGGAKYFSPKEQNGTDLIDKFRQSGYTVAADRNQLRAAPSNRKLIGLFNQGYMQFVNDRDIYQSNEPTLNEMTEKALGVLDGSDKGFFLMVEGGRIDHASHAADFTGIWKETAEFDSTVKEVTSWAKKRGDTLVVVLADHETMGISSSEPMNVSGLKNVKASSEYMASQLKKTSDGEIIPESLLEVFHKYANIKLSPQETQELIKNLQSPGKSIYPSQITGWEIGSVIALHNLAGAQDRSIRAASKTTGGHTANSIAVFAEGPGSENFKGVIDNTDISKIIMKAAHISFVPGQHKTR
ncbi:alkaline phosphatase [Bacillus sp. OV322]|uniref:alkaline phosphatase n=1 Tax=Bacillus sp. OV322 TaxID=1882764 RepID=UPI0008EE49F9|nr:alkaline phosphatase [Bacillus sp. OV322]SFC23291.1 alkaline phosphatase [Bacillus sp. OV322]